MNNYSHIKPKKSEFQEKVLEIKRVTRVMAGGKRMSFRATVILGDKKGKVGLGIGKGLDVAASVEKAKRQAQKNMITVNLKDKRTIPYEIEEKFDAARVRLKPAKKNHGLIAGGSVRTVLELAGIKDISAKILGRTTNKLTNALAAMKALNKLENVESKPIESKIEEK
ncbi:30S ribosomal protein S5 [Patescibacteria group bacterium]|nr:30S ribosomal protein S5 [Patescibacteria group bacterium]